LRPFGSGLEESHHRRRDKAKASSVLRMIHLEENLYVGADKYQFILREKRQTEESGKVYWKDLGYYPNLSTLIRGLSDRKLYQFVEQGKSLKAMQEEFVTWAESLKTPLVAELKQAVKAYQEKDDE